MGVDEQDVAVSRNEEVGLLRVRHEDGETISVIARELLKLVTKSKLGRHEWGDRGRQVSFLGGDVNRSLQCGDCLLHAVIDCLTVRCCLAIVQGVPFLDGCSERCNEWLRQISEGKGRADFRKLGCQDDCDYGASIAAFWTSLPPALAQDPREKPGTTELSGLNGSRLGRRWRGIRAARCGVRCSRSFAQSRVCLCGWRKVWTLRRGVVFGRRWRVIRAARC